MHTVLPCARENGRSGSRRPRVHCRLESPILPRLPAGGSGSRRSPPPTRRARRSRRDGNTPKERDTRVRRAPARGEASRGRNRHDRHARALQRTVGSREHNRINPPPFESEPQEGRPRPLSLGRLAQRGVQRIRGGGRPSLMRLQDGYAMILRKSSFTVS